MYYCKSCKHKHRGIDDSNKIEKTKDPDLVREYNTIHQYILRKYPKTGICNHCSATVKTQWANKDGQYNRYDRDNWLELCLSCHQKYDKDNHEHRFYRKIWL